MKTETFIDILLQAPVDIKQEYANKKLPKIIKKLLMKRDIKKYYNSIDRLIEEGVVLNKNALFQFLSILENEYKPVANYRNINSITLIEGNNYKYIMATLLYKDFKAVIRVRNNEDNFEIELKCFNKKERNISSYTFIDNIMKSKNQEYSDYIHRINITILESISKYFKDYIYKYTMEE